MSTSRVGTAVAWVLSGLLALAFLASGVPKLLMIEVWARKFAQWGYPVWFLLLIGALEVGGATLLLIPRWTRYGVLLLGVVMVGAMYTHVSNGEGLQVLRPLIVGAALGVLAWLRAPARLPARAAG